MLIINLRQNGKVIIGAGRNKITVSVEKIFSDQVKLGIDAPREIPIHREELLAKMKANLKKANSRSRRLSCRKNWSKNLKEGLQKQKTN